MKALGISVVMLTLAAIVATFVAPAIATHSVGSKITLSNGIPGDYEGAVSSKKEGCVKGRSVSVYHDQNKNGVDQSDFKIGTSRTDKDGEYLIQGNQAPEGDTIIAVAKSRKLGKRHSCRKAQKSEKALK